jgi:hypothetical protein
MLATTSASPSIYIVPVKPVITPIDMLQLSQKQQEQLKTYIRCGPTYNA